MTTPSGPALGRASAQQKPRVLAAANVSSRAGSGIEGRFVRVLSTAVLVRGTQSLRVSVIRSAGVHRRQPLLAHSFVGSVDPMYWRKTVVTGPMDDGRVGLELRIPKRVLEPGQRYAVRVRAVGSTGIRTIYIRFRG